MFHLRLRLRWTVLLSWAVLATLHPSSGQGQSVSCTQRDDQLCFQGGRFVATVDWTIPGGRSGRGHAVPLTTDTGLFWFFDNSNVELVLKVLDGRPANGHFWVYYGGLSDVSYTLTVADLHTGAREVYRNRPGRLVSRSHTSAFLPEAPGIPTDTTGLPSSRLLRQGSEFQANVTSRGEQRSPSVAVGPDGGFMVAWMDRNPSTTLRDVFGRFYGPAGQPLSGEVRLRTSINGDQASARLAASRTGEYMAVWLDGPGLFGRVFGPDGTPLSGEIRIGFGPGGSQSSPAITADPAGGFLVAWVDALGLPLSPWPIRWQRFDNRGGRVGLELGIERPFPGLTAVASSPDGGFVLVWHEAAEVFGTDILALRLDATGVPLHSEALRVNTDDVRRYSGSHQFLTPLVHPDGDFSIVWATSVFPPFPGTAGIYARRYDALGRPVTPVVALRAGIQGVDARPAAAALPSGESLVVWFEETSSRTPTAASTASSSTAPGRRWAARAASTPIRRTSRPSRPWRWTPAAPSSPPGAAASMTSASSRPPASARGRRTASSSASSASASPWRAAPGTRPSSAWADASGSKSGSPTRARASRGRRAPSR